MICWLAKTKFLRAALGFVLLVTSCQAVKAAGETPPLLSFTRAEQPTLPSAAPQQLPVDQKVMTAALQVPPASAKANRAAKPAERPQQNHRLLAPSHAAASRGTGRDSTYPYTTIAPAFGLPKIESLATAGAGLAIVVGLFLVCMWLLRRSGPKPTSPLPSEAVAVLGRVPLAAQEFCALAASRQQIGAGGDYARRRGSHHRGHRSSGSAAAARIVPR